jgi:Tfp pilus assembly protein PilZ
LVGAVSGLGLLVVSFLPWFSAGGADATAWQSFSVIDLVLLAAAIVSLSVALVVVTRLSVSYPVAGSAVATGVGAAAFVCVLYRLIDPPGGSGVDREVGVWLGLLAAAGVTLGGYLGMQPRSAPGHAAGNVG